MSIFSVASGIPLQYIFYYFLRKEENYAYF